MTVQAAVATLLFLIAIGCTLRANLLFGEIVAEINRVLPTEQAISLAGFVRHRFFEILGKYRKLYPDGKLVLRFAVWSGLGFGFLFVSVGYWFFSKAASTG